jgi:hypothetical protein
MNPQGKGGAFAPIQGDDEHQGDERLKLSGTLGAAAPDPAAYGLSPPLFQPLTAYAARGRIFPAPARGTRTPSKEHASGGASGSRMDRAKQTPGQQYG